LRKIITKIIITALIYFRQWYVLYGGMQDWNYIWHGDMEITLELGDTKCPLDNELDQYWQVNREALFAYMDLVRTLGVRGTVTDAQGNPVERATVHVREFNSTVTSDAQGEYYRLLLPGRYRVLNYI
jgi:hypothetical protein